VRFSSIMHIQNMAILKGLVSVAWADGRFAGEEVEVLEALLQAFEATPSEAHEIRLYAREPRTLNDVPIHDLSADARRILLQHAVLLSFVDGDQDEKERALIDGLCEVLRIPAVESRGIIVAAEERAKSLLKLL
jgi:tellurite resistance protein